MNLKEQTADKIVDIIKASGLRGIVFVTKVGSEGMTAGIYASPVQTGALLGAGVFQLAQDAVKRGEYDDFMHGFLNGIANVPDFKKFLEQLDAKLNADAKS